jgi:hypothetical protein
MSGLASDGDHLVWHLTYDGVEMGGLAKEFYDSYTYILTLDSGALTEVHGNANAGGMNVATASSGWVGWGNGSGWGDTTPYLMNLADNTIYALPTQMADPDVLQNGDIRINFPAVAWATAGPKGDVGNFMTWHVGMLSTKKQ